MENGEGLSQSGLYDEKSDFIEEGLKWLDYKDTG